MGVLDGVVIVEREGEDLGVNLGRPIVTNRGLCCVVVRKRRSLPKLLWGRDLLHIRGRGVTT